MSYADLAPAWKPGETGNPRGLTRQHRAIIRHCRVNSRAMADTLIACAKDSDAPWSARIAAAASVLDRAWGKPKEQVEISNENGVPMLTLRFVDPNGAVADETVTLLTPESGPAGAPGEQEFALTFRRGK